MSLKQIDSSLRDIKANVNSIDKTLAAQAVTLAVNTESLKHHMARTSANEDRIKFIERAMMGTLITALIGALVKFLFY